jgi:hypothetical protein
MYPAIHPFLTWQKPVPSSNGLRAAARCTCRALDCCSVADTTRRPGSPPTAPWSSLAINLLRCCRLIFNRYCMRLWGRIKVAAQVGSWHAASSVSRGTQRSGMGLLAFVGSYFIPPLARLQMRQSCSRPQRCPPRKTHIGCSLMASSILLGNDFGALSS